MLALEENHAGVLGRVAAVRSYDSANDSTGREPEDEVGCVLAGTRHDGRVVFLVLVVEPGAKPAPRGGERVLAGGEVFEREIPVSVSLRGGDDLSILFAEDGNGRAPHRFACGGIHYAAGNAVGSCSS